MPNAVEKLFREIAREVYISISDTVEGYPNLSSWHKRLGCFDKVKEEHEKEKVYAVLVDEAQFLSKKDIHNLSDIPDYLDIPVEGPYKPDHYRY